jgi:ribosome-binding factor A
MEIGTLLTDVLLQAGPMAAIVFFFVWKDNRTDARNAEAREDANKYIRERLETAIRENTQALKELRDAIGD